jgi:hypothetical protein
MFIFHVHNPSGTHVASCEHAEDAAAIVNLYGDGATIRFMQGGHALWTEGKEDMPAGESYDFVTEVCEKRLDQLHQASMERKRK